MSPESVAEVYNQAAREGHSPLTAVALAMGKSKATASRHVNAARAAGLIDSELGRSGYINAKAMRVAQALGIPYSDLIAAVLEHADGDLRVMPATR